MSQLNDTLQYKIVDILHLEHCLILSFYSNEVDSGYVLEDSKTKFLKMKFSPSRLNLIHDCSLCVLKSVISLKIPLLRLSYYLDIDSMVFCSVRFTLVMDSIVIPIHWCTPIVCYQLMGLSNSFNDKLLFLHFQYSSR